jgi:thioredoxin reductase
MEKLWDCIVVGGGAAGLSAALVLGRARRRTLVVDAGRPSNAVAAGIGGLLGQDHRPPADLYATGRRELAAYPSVEVRTGEVVDGRRDGATFTLDLDDGTHVAGTQVLLATGMDYRYADVPGLAERWGRSVFHCPFCHGWEVRDRALGVLGDGDAGVHRSLLLRMWSDDVTLFTDGPAALTADDRARLAARDVAVVERPVASVRGPGDELEAVCFSDGTEQACGGLLVAVTLHQRSGLAAALGAELAEPGMLAADAVKVDALFHTSVAGLYAAGDANGEMPSVANAIASGGRAAASMVGDMALTLPALAEA